MFEPHIDSGDAISGFALDDSSIIITDDCNDDVSHGPSLPLNPSISADIPYISIALLSSLAASTIHPCSRMMITFATLKRDRMPMLSSYPAVTIDYGEPGGHR